jgi:hypothetical protein
MKAHSLDSSKNSGQSILQQMWGQHPIFTILILIDQQRSGIMQAQHRRVRFETCISLIFLTRHRLSEPIEIGPTERAAWASVPYCLVTFLLGWWGLPWGIFLTPVVLWRNLRGGHELPQDQASDPSPPAMLPSERQQV